MTREEKLTTLTAAALGALIAKLSLNRSTIFQDQMEHVTRAASIVGKKALLEQEQREIELSTEPKGF